MPSAAWWVWSDNLLAFGPKDIETFAEGIPGAEGLAVANDGRVWVGAEDGWVYAISPQGEVAQFVKLPGRPLGIAIDREDNLFICDWDLNALYKANPKDEISLFADNIPSPNFCVFDDDANLYVTSTGSSRRMKNIHVPDGAVFRISKEGHSEVFADGLDGANGLAIRRAEFAIYVIQTSKDDVLRLEITPDGSCGERTVFAKGLDGSPDGMAFTAEGDLLVVTGLREIIYRVRPNGAMDIFAEDANAEKMVSPANPAFGGRELNELYITNPGGNSVSKIRNVPRRQKLFHQLFRLTEVA